MITKERKEQVWGDNYPMLMMIYQIEKIMLKEHIYKLAEKLYGATKNDVDKFINECLEVGFLKRKQIGLQNKWMYMLTKYPIAKIEEKSNTRKVATLVPSVERIKLSLLKTQHLLNLLNKVDNDYVDFFDKKCNSIWNINKTESIKVFEYLESLNIPMTDKFKRDYKLEKLKYKRLKKIASENELKEIKDIQKENKRRLEGLKNNRVQMSEGKPIANLLYYQELYTLSNFLGSGFRINKIKKNDTKIIIQVIYYNLSELDTGNVYKNTALFYNLLKNYFVLENQEEVVLKFFFYGTNEYIKKFSNESLEKKKNFYTGTLCKNEFYKNKLLAYGLSEIDFNNKKIITKTKELDFSQYNLSLDDI